MASWARSNLQSASSILLSPYYGASSLFWIALGYGPSSRPLLEAMAPVTRVEGSAPTPTRSCFPPLNVELRDVEQDEDGGILGYPHDGTPVEDVSGAGVVSRGEDNSSPRSSLSASEIETSPPFHLRHPTVSFTKLDSPFEPLADLYTRPNGSALADRPLSLLLAQFSHRTSARLSSLELFDDMLSLRHLGEPTTAQMELLQEQMETSAEIEEVKRVVEREVERMEVEKALDNKIQERTWFNELDMSFRDVQMTQDGIETLGWLRATESLLHFFETFAPAAASLAGADIREDIRRIRAHYLSAPVECRTLELLVAHELPQRRKLATEALIWCVRGLKFVSLALRFSLDSPTEELSTSFTRAWDQDYSQYFSWMIRPLFKLLIRACPPREQLFIQLGHPREKVEQELRLYLDAVDAQTAQLLSAYRSDR